jgi:hypothetical protein
MSEIKLNFKNKVERKMKKVRYRVSALTQKVGILVV